MRHRPTRARGFPCDTPETPARCPVPRPPAPSQPQHAGRVDGGLGPGAWPSSTGKRGQSAGGAWRPALQPGPGPRWLCARGEVPLGRA